MDVLQLDGSHGPDNHERKCLAFWGRPNQRAEDILVFGIEVLLNPHVMLNQTVVISSFVAWWNGARAEWGWFSFLL